ncbi:MAG: glycosyltransferase [Deltaproteobacteria bacterium]|nr:glycosyltransferase [Deltaproteobacteria bacterium]
MSPIPDNNFVFLDKQGKRWPRFRLFILISSVIVFLCSVVFVQSLFVMSQLHLPPSIQKLKERLKVLQKKESLLQAVTKKPLWLEFSRASQTGQKQAKSGAKSQPPVNTLKRICLGFYAGWDPNSFSSLQAHADQLTHVCPEWLTMEDGTGTLISRPDRTVQTIAQKKGIVLLPLLSNLTKDNWQPEAVEGVANGPEDRQFRFVLNLMAELETAGAGGVVIDWGQVDPTYKDNVTRLLQRISASLHEKKMELWLRVPMGLELKVFDIEALSANVDRFIAVLHDENSETDQPGPIASQDWFDGWLDAVIAYGKPSQWIVELGLYGYDWASGEKKAETISFADAMTRAGRAGLQTNEVTSPAYNPNFSYTDAGVEHTVWFLDVATFANQLKSALNLDVGGIAIFQLGSEDPSIWTTLQMNPFDINSEFLAKISDLKSSGATQVGTGEFLSIEDSRSDGTRNLKIDSSGRITETYEKFPSYLTVSHQGEGKEDEVAITFDDGPDPEWTVPILDILKAKGVKASFFMVGLQMEKHPGLVQRIVQEGHEIGVHTYTHPNLALVSEERAKIELNATQRLIETITGRSTILFRPPYNADSRPSSPSEILPLKLAQDMGYLTVTEDIDPEDWEMPGVDVILERIKQSRRLGGNIILLHDAGGDRHQTVEVLPQIIDYILARGDQVVSLSKLLGEPPEALMPIVQPDQHPVTRLVSGSGFRVYHVVAIFLWSFMIVATILVVLRTIAVTVLALLQQRHAAGSPKTSFSPSLCVLIAAYNEEAVIAKTLQSVLTTTYSGDISVWVVDDGSTDKTAGVVESFFGKDHRVHLIQQSNKGKAMALRSGLESVTSDIVVMLDADTQFQPDTLQRLVQPLLDKKVAAVSGHAKVGNLRKFIARCQSLEYICGFNLDRQAYHYLNCITVVPGAVSALRKSAIIQAGGISTDTLAEDTDLTLSLHREGFRIAYVSDALAFTEAPETIATLAKQRFRWAFGTIQCLWKHRDMVLNSQFKALGYFSLPSIWFFQVLLVAIAPVIDALVIGSLLLGMSSPSLYAYFGIFLLMDFLLAALACLMEHEPLRQAWLTIPMRFVYRPMLSWVIWKALIKAAKGALVSWGKLDRTASVT